MKYSVTNKHRKYKYIKDTIACTGNHSLLPGFHNIVVVFEKFEICESPSSIMKSVQWKFLSLCGAFVNNSPDYEYPHIGKFNSHTPLLPLWALLCFSNELLL